MSDSSDNTNTSALKQDLDNYQIGYEDGKQDGKVESAVEIRVLKAENKALQQEIRAEKAERKLAELKLELATQNA